MTARSAILTNQVHPSKRPALPEWSQWPWETVALATDRYVPGAAGPQKRRGADPGITESVATQLSSSAGFATAGNWPDPCQATSTRKPYRSGPIDSSNMKATMDLPGRAWASCRKISSILARDGGSLTTTFNWTRSGLSQAIAATWKSGPQISGTSGQAASPVSGARLGPCVSTRPVVATNRNMATIAISRTLRLDEWLELERTSVAARNERTRLRSTRAPLLSVVAQPEWRSPRSAN